MCWAKDNSMGSLFVSGAFPQWTNWEGGEAWLLKLSHGSSGIWGVQRAGCLGETRCQLAQGHQVLLLEAEASHEPRGSRRPLWQLTCPKGIAEVLLRLCGDCAALVNFLKETAWLLLCVLFPSHLAHVIGTMLSQGSVWCDRGPFQHKKGCLAGVCAVKRRTPVGFPLSCSFGFPLDTPHKCVGSRDRTSINRKEHQ